MERATAEAEGHAAAAAQSAVQAKDSATESARQANYANVRADRAEKASDSAEDAAARAEGFAGKLEDSYTVQMAVAGLAEQFYTLSDRVTKLELRHVTEDPDWIEPEPWSNPAQRPPPMRPWSPNLKNTRRSGCIPSLSTPNLTQETTHG